MQVHSNSCFGKYQVQNLSVRQGYIPGLEGPHCSATFNISTALNFLAGRTALAINVIKEAVEIVEGFVEEDARHVDVVFEGLVVASCCCRWVVLT